MITASVFVNADVARIPEVAEQIASLPGVTEVYSVTGALDLIAMIRVRDHDAVAEVVAPASGAERRGRRAALPIDVTRTLEQLLSRDDVDICHVHEPFAPSLPSVALRHSRALNVGTFHTPTERLIASMKAETMHGKAAVSTTFLTVSDLVAPKA